MRLIQKFALAAISALGVSASVQAQSYPTKPVVLVVPFAAGGPTDILARTLAKSMTENLKQTVVVENTAGAGGTIAANRVAKAQPDGYTLLIHHNGMATAVGLYRKLPYDPLIDFEQVGLAGDVPMTLLGKKDLPPNTFPEFLTYLKANRDKLNWAHAGLGAVSQLCSMLFQQAIGVDVTTVPYKGTAPAMTDLLGGQVDVLCDQTTQTLPHIASGGVKVYGVTAPNRISALPKVPTIAESGLKNFEVVVWHGVYAPKGTPAPVVTRVNQAMQAAFKDPDVIKRYKELGAEFVPATRTAPLVHKVWLKQEIDKWTPIIKKAGQYAD